MTTSPRAIARRWIRARNSSSANRRNPATSSAAVKSAKPDAIMHFAASALVGESMTNPKKYFHNNVVNALKLADAAVECGVKKFVFSSTCATYGPPDKMPMTEDLPQRPINPYGEAKLMFEKILNGISRFTSWSSSRSAISTPPARARNSANITASRRTSFRTCSRSRSARSRTAKFSARIIPRPTAPASAITSISRIWRRRTCSDCSRARQGFYNLGNGDGYSVKQVIQMCEKITGKKSRRLKSRAAPAIRPGSSPPPTRRSANSAGNRIPEAGRHRRHRLGMAQKKSGRLSGLPAGG
jgi:nucleoside-diphosphate-sugar epimerase